MSWRSARRFLTVAVPILTSTFCTRGVDVAIIAGIDEAGFGPLLGPLVVSGVAFRIPDSHVDRCLWDTLSDTCRKTPSRDARRLPIADSKQLFRSRATLAPLERAALVMLAVRGKRPATWRGLLNEVAPKAAEVLEDYPWYAVTDVALPLCSDVGDVPTRANAIRRNCREQQVEPVGVFCEPLLEGHYNRLVGGTRNKSVVLLGLALRVIDRILRCTPERRVRICVDRLGGRIHYREALSTAMPECDFQILEESPDRSAYRLVDQTRILRIEFTTGGEDRHFSVALASVYSKYLRELYMHVFNGYWSAQVRGLRPTAGYYTDAKRWLRDAAPAMKRLAVRRDSLVRSR